MVIANPCYCNRDDVMRAPDFKPGLITTGQVDRALQRGAETIEGQLHRKFYPVDETVFWDWPNYQYAYPWRLWLNRHDLVCLTQLQSPGNSGGTGGVTVPLWQVIPGPVNRRRGWPYTRVDLDRSTVAAWGTGPTPQNAIWLTGTWGFTADADDITTTAASTSSADATFTVADGSQCGAGDVLILGYSRGAAAFPAFLGTAGSVQPYLGERVIVQDKTAADTGLAQGAGCTAAQDNDDALTFTGSGQLHAGEVIELDQERMLVEQIANGVATVHRAWDATALAEHTAGTEIFALRQLTVLRAQLGTAAATWNSGTAVWRHRPPQTIRDLNLAEALNQVLQEQAGYSRTIGSGEAAMPAPGTALAELWDEARTGYGRKAARKGAI